MLYTIPGDPASVLVSFRSANNEECIMFYKIVEIWLNAAWIATHIEWTEWGGFLFYGPSHPDWPVDFGPVVMPFRRYLAIQPHDGGSIALLCNPYGRPYEFSWLLIADPDCAEKLVRLART